jgi:hypothetical protein
MSTSPSPPLGPYPQLLLWGHVGIAPMSMSTTTMSRIIPMDMAFLRL